MNTPIQTGLFSQITLNNWLNSTALDTAEVFLQPPADGTQTKNNTPRTYHVAQMGNLPLVKFLQDTFTANVTVVNMPGMKTTSELLQLNQYSSDVASALWNFQDLDNFTSNLADRMTDALRKMVPDADFSPQGQVYVVKSYIHVRWQWLTLPVGTVLGSSLLLIASIISAHGHRDTMWKNSCLALLFHGFGAPEQSHRVDFKKEMEEVAEKKNVKLKEDGQGNLRFLELK